MNGVAALDTRMVMPTPYAAPCGMRLNEHPAGVEKYIHTRTFVPVADPVQARRGTRIIATQYPLEPPVIVIALQ